MKSKNGVESSVNPFVEISDASKLIPILEKRLPKSCHIYNAAKMHSRFPDQMSFYTINGEVDDSSLIVSTHYRENQTVISEDYGNDYSVSSPDPEKSKISKEEAIKIFSESTLFKWDEPYFFVAVSELIREIVCEVALKHKGNTTNVHPCKLFYLDSEDCENLDISVPEGEEIELKRLDPVQGPEFILNTWKYAKEGSADVIQRLVERNESGGVYVNEKVAGGVIVHGFGLVTALYVLKEHRKKGYANLCMKFAYKQLAKSGMIPASAVELRNGPSLTFHEKLGCKVADNVYGIFYTKPQF